jgi:hypothetical protein
MGSDRSVLGLTLPLLVLTAVPSALVSAGAIERFNGPAWSVVPSPNQGTGNNAHTVDYNSDGWPDLLICGETGGLHLFENDQGQIDYTHDGLSSFLVLNGQGLNPGPIQLLTPQLTSMRALTRTVSFRSGAVRKSAVPHRSHRYGNREHI